MIAAAAGSHKVPAGFLTRLIWQESSFRTGVTSPVGAQGIAQFMPGTARERGLSDPFDPEQAIPKAAEFIAELSRQFGNLGLAAAAYNGGPARVAAWLAGEGGLPAETRSYVYAITRRSPEEWAEAAKGTGSPADLEDAQSCLQLAAILRRPGGAAPGEAPFAPWGIQLAGNFSKDRALAAFDRARKAYAPVVGDIRPMVIGTRLRYRGSRTFYRVRIPAQTRAAAAALCEKIRRAGGSCIVLPS